MVPIKYAVKISFSDFQLEYDKSCFFDSVEFFEGGYTTASASLGRYCGLVKPTNVRSKMNIMTIKFSSDLSVNYKGFNLSWNLTDPIYPRKSDSVMHFYKPYSNCKSTVNIL